MSSRTWRRGLWIFSFSPTCSIFFLTHAYFLSHSRVFSFSPTCSIFFLTHVYFLSHPRVVFSFSPTCIFFLTHVYFLSHPRVVFSFSLTCIFSLTHVYFSNIFKPHLVQVPQFLTDCTADSCPFSLSIYLHPLFSRGSHFYPTEWCNSCLRNASH